MASGLTGLTKTYVSSYARAFGAAIAPLTAFSTTAFAEGHAWNDNVVIPFVQAASASIDWAAATGYDTAQSNVNGKSISLSIYKYQRWDISDNDFNKLSEGAIQAIGESAGNRLGLDFLSAVVANTSSFSNFTTPSGSQWATTAAVDLGVTASVQGWTRNQRSLLVKPALTRMLLANNTNTLAYAIGDNTVLKDGVLTRYMGFDVFETDILPATIFGLAASKNAYGVGLAYCPVQEGHNYSVVERIDTEYGFPMGYVEYYDNTLRKKIRAFDVLGGSGVLSNNGAYNLLVTAPQL